MSQADPWSWGVDEGSATESDQWSNGWAGSARQQHQQQQHLQQQHHQQLQHHQQPPIGQPCWGDSSGGVRGVGPPPKAGAPPPKGGRQPMYGRPQQRIYPTVPINNNVVNPLRTDVENSEIAPPDAFSNVGEPPLQRPGMTATPHQPLRSQPIGPPVSTATYFNQHPPEPAQEAFSYTQAQSQEAYVLSQSGQDSFTYSQIQSNQQQVSINSTAEPQNFFNQFSGTPNANNNNQDFFHQFLTPSTEWNGGNRMNDGTGTEPLPVNSQIKYEPVDNFSDTVHNNFGNHHFNHQNIPQPEIMDQTNAPVQDYLNKPNDQIVHPQSSVPDIGNTPSQVRNQPPLQNYFSIPFNNDQELPMERKQEDPSAENGFVPDNVSYGDNTVPGMVHDQPSNTNFVSGNLPPNTERDFFFRDQNDQRHMQLEIAPEPINETEHFNVERHVDVTPFCENNQVQQNRLDGEGLAAPQQEQGAVRHPPVLEGQEHDAAVGRSKPNEVREHHEYPIRNMSMIDGHEDVKISGRVKDDSPAGSSNVVGHTQRREKPQGESSESSHSKRSVTDTHLNSRSKERTRNKSQDSNSRDDRRGEGQERSQSGLPEDEQDWEVWDANADTLKNDEYPKHEARRPSPRFPSPGQAPEVGSAFRKYEAASREAEGESSPPPPRVPAAGHSPSPPRRPMLPDNQETLPDISSITLNQNETVDGVYGLDRNEYLETSQLSTQSLPDPRQQRHYSSGRGPRGSGEREIEGEAEGGGRVVVGGGRKQPVHSTPVHNTSSPATNSQLQGPPAGQPGQHSPSGRQDDRADLSVVREGGSGDGDDYRPHRTSSGHHHHHRGPSHQQGTRTNNRSRHMRHRPPSSHRDSSYDDEEDEYSSGGGPRSRRHRHPPSVSTSRSIVQSSEYISDEDYEYDSRRSYQRDRRKEQEYIPEYARRDAYRDDRRRDRNYYERHGYSRHESDDHDNYRPSSRGGSDYHVRRHRPAHIDPAVAAWGQYYHHATGFGFDQYSQECLEIARRSNPVLYAIWYNEYVSKIAAANNDRASVHSGQSGRGLMSNERVPSSNTPPTRSTDAVHGEESVDASSITDYTPRLFSSAHARGSYDSMGRLVVVDAHDPIDGQSASVVMCSVEQVMSSCDTAFAQFLDCPGPFVPNLTHRSTVLQFLKRQSDQATFSSEKLLYDFVHLTLKSNGTANVSDVAELLMESYTSSLEKRKRGRSGSGASGSTSNGGNLIDDVIPPVQSSCGVDDPTAPLDGFRDLLQQGDKSQALEWAIGRNLWGHALLLSSKMDARTHQAVTGRFAASLPPSDPLQTLYQLMSGLIPQAASSCGDSKWCDWRPHLAMMLSNSGVELVSGLGGQDPKSPLADLTSRSILVMADTLASRGRYFAAHFCYLVAKVSFSAVGESGSRLVLLGSTPENLEYTNYRSLMLTMCYEFAIRQADSSFTIKSLPRYKALAGWRLAEAGRSRAALQYCEAVALDARLGNCDADAVAWVAELAQYLEALDSHGDQRPDWLINLLALNDSLPQDETPVTYPNQTLQSHQIAQHSYRFQPTRIAEEPREPPRHNEQDNIDGHVQPGPLLMNPAEPLMQPPMQPGIQQPLMQQVIQQPMMQQPIQQPMMQQGIQQPMMQQGIQTMMQQGPQQPSVMPPSTPQHHATFQSQQPSQMSNGYQESMPVSEKESDGFLSADPEPEVQPTSSKPMNFFEISEHQLQGEGYPGEVKRPSQPSHQPASQSTALSQNDKKPSSDPGAGGSGWLGSIMGKFSRRPKNQMILPDDNDPKIVYDPKLKSWVDKDGSTPSAKEMKPPPSLGLGSGPSSLPVMPGGGPPSLPSGPNLMPSVGMGGPTSLPPSANSNRYKLQKGKSMKSNYVDVLGGSGAAKPLAQIPQNIFNPGLSQGVPEAETQGGYSEMGNIAMETQQPFMYNPGSYPS